MNTQNGIGEGSACNALLSGLPELTPQEREAMDAFPKDAVRHWIRGERFDFGLRRWVAPQEQFAEEKPAEYEFQGAFGFGGVISCERYRCPDCGHSIEYSR